jgi:hypothetical protein
MVKIAIFFHAQEIIMKHVQSVYLGRRNFHYLMSGLVLDDHWDTEVAEYGAINITGLRIVRPGQASTSNCMCRQKFSRSNHSKCKEFNSGRLRRGIK